jgi:ADP-ribose pyrophosphatase
MQQSPAVNPDDRHLREELLQRTSIFDGRLLHVFEDTVRLADGNEARREVVEHAGAVTVEETGYHAADWRELGHGPVSPGYSSEELWFYLARGLSSGDSTPDTDELLDVELFSAAQLARLARDGEVDLKTLAGLALAGITLNSADV